MGEQEDELAGLTGQANRTRRRRRRVSAGTPGRTLLHAMGMVWAAPLTLVGLLIALPILCARGQLCVVHAPTPALLVFGRGADFLLARHPFGAMCAMAIGHVVIADRQSLTPQILTHELAHVRQASMWGPLFPFAYVAASGWAVLHGQDAYWNNTFEVAARRAERHGPA